MDKDSRIFIVDRKKMAESALIRKLESAGFTDVAAASSRNLDLTDQISIKDYFKEEKPHYVFLIGGKSGGINANINHPAEFIYDNLQIQNNVIHYSYKFGAKKLLFFGSSCAYPKNASQPIKEEYFLSGELEKTSEPYALAKIAGLKMVNSYRKQYGADFIAAIPATIFGPEDEFDLENSHVISSLIRKFHNAKINNVQEVNIWGTGKACREFLFADDFAEASIFLMNEYNSSEIINIGGGKDISIKELALLISEITGYSGEIVYDISKPDGTLRKLLDNSKIEKLGWRAKTDIIEGLRITYKWFKENIII